jgi:hypothetical protein
MSKKVINNRHFPRLARTLKLETSDGIELAVVDISVSGLRVQSAVPIELGQAIKGKLATPDGEEINVQGRVVWATPEAFRGHSPLELGIEITKVTRAYLQALAELFADAD